MDVHLLNLLSSYGDVGIMLMFLFWKSKQMDDKHTQAIKMLKEMRTTSSNIEKQLAIFSLKLDHGDDRFIKVEEDIKMLKSTQIEIRQRIHDIKDDMVSKEMYTMIKELEKGANQGTI